MRKKGAASRSLETIIILAIALIVVLGIAIVATGKIEDAKNVPGPSGDDSGKLDDCREYCKDPESTECTTPDKEGVSCAQHIENQNRHLIVTYSPEILSKSAGEIALNIKTSDGAELRNVDISGSEVSNFKSDGTSYRVILNRAKMSNLRLIDGSLFIILYAKAAGYPQRIISISVDEKGSGEGTVGGDISGGTSTGGSAGSGAGEESRGVSDGNAETSDSSIILLQAGKEVSQITPNEQTEIKIKKKDGSTAPPWMEEIDLTNEAGAKVMSKCGISASETCFKLKPLQLVNALSKGVYKLKITVQESNAAEKLVQEIQFTWCPLPMYDFRKNFRPGETIEYLFESQISDAGKVTVLLNGKSDAILDKKISSDDSRKISFKLPPVGNGINEGENELRVERSGEGLCIMDGGLKNFHIKPFSWSCAVGAPTGCYAQSGKEYVLKTNQDAGGYLDVVTGCHYAEKAADACANGCMAGACRQPKIEIISVEIEGLDAESSKIYENPNVDRIITVTVKNTGTFAAEKVNEGTSAKIDDIELTPISAPKSTASVNDPLISDNSENLEEGKSGEYFFMLPKGTPAVPLSKTSVPAQLSVTIKASNTASSVTWNKVITFYTP